MPRRKLPHIQVERTKTKVYYYFRRTRGGPRVRLPDEYGTPEFMAAYHAALKGEDAPKPVKAAKGTLRWLVDTYKRSLAFAELADSTRRNRDRLLRAICDTKGVHGKMAGDMPLSAITVETIETGMQRRVEGGPEAANAFLKTMRGLLDFGVRAKAIRTNPARDVEMLSGSPDGFHTWTVEEVEQFEARHPVGTKARLAMDLMLYTGLRKSDVVLVTHKHISAGVMTITPKKTQRTSGVTVTVRLHPRLVESIKAAPTGDSYLLVTTYNKPFTANGFGNWFRDRCDEAGVPGSAHGLRKAGATRLAEEGATTQQLMAYFGWTTSKEAERYTKAADRRRLGLAASDLWVGVPRESDKARDTDE